MRRRSFLAGLLAVPVAVACDPRGVSRVPVSPGSLGGTAVADLASLDDWHYVGDAGEPAFENSWANSAVAGNPKVAFRIREDGVVDLQGVAVSAASATTVFSLPPGYVPSVKAPGFVGMSAAGDPYMVDVTADGDVRITPLPANGTEVEFSGQVFLTPPDLVT